MSLFAVSPGYIIAITPQTAAVPGAFSGFSTVETAAPRAIASGADILVGSLSWTAAACILPGGAFVSGGGIILSTSTKCYFDGVRPLREGDVGTCAGSFTTQGGPVPCACKMEIKTAGQTKAGGE